MVILLLLPCHRLCNPAMIWADVVASSHEDNSRHDGRDVGTLHDAHQKLSPHHAVGQKQYARDEPDQPGQNADPPRASLDEQMMYLRVVSDDDKRRSHPAYDFHVQPRHLVLILRSEEIA